MRTRKARLADGDGRGVFTGGDGRSDPFFQSDEMRIAKAQQHLLECVMTRGVEWPAVAHAIARRMRGIDVGAGYPARRDRLGRGMAAAVTQEIGQHMSVRAVRTFAVGRRDWREHLGRPSRLTNTRCGLAASITPMAGLPGANTSCPACTRKRAATSGSDTRTQTST
jgi:hypothetical protein